LDIVKKIKKIWALLRKLLAPPVVPGYGPVFISISELNIFPHNVMVFAFIR